MAFTGTAVVQQISDSIVRITGLSLGAGANGTIGFADHSGTAPGVSLPEAFKTQHYTYGGVNVPFAASVEVDVIPVATTGDFEQVAVAKTGTTRGDFRITVSNGFASVTPGLEIYVKFHN